MPDSLPPFHTPTEQSFILKIALCVIFLHIAALKLGTFWEFTPPPPQSRTSVHVQTIQLQPSSHVFQSNEMLPIPAITQSPILESPSIPKEEIQVKTDILQEESSKQEEVALIPLEKSIEKPMSDHLPHVKIEKKPDPQKLTPTPAPKALPPPTPHEVKKEPPAHKPAPPHKPAQNEKKAAIDKKPPVKKPLEPVKKKEPIGPTLKSEAEKKKEKEKAEAEKKRQTEVEKKKQEERIEAEKKRIREAEVEKKRKHELAMAQEAAKEKEQLLLAKAKENFAKMGETRGKISSSPSTNLQTTTLPTALESLHVEALSLGEPANSGEKWGNKEVSYSSEVAYRLKNGLCLPGYGSVKIKLTLDRMGKVLAVETMESESAKNKAYVESQLPTLTFPPFGSKFQDMPSNTFIYTLENAS